MEVLGVIPARFASTRFEGKVLADILGKPMIQWVYEAASKVKLLDDLIIACDDERIKKEAERFGAKAILTSRDHASGRSEEHTSELQSHSFISYAVFCLKKKKY